MKVQASRVPVFGQHFWAFGNRFMHSRRTSNPHWNVSCLLTGPQNQTWLTTWSVSGLANPQITRNVSYQVRNQKNNCILEPPKPDIQFRFRCANSFGKIPKMGSQKSRKIIQITLILAKTSFMLNFRNIQVCSDSRRVRTLVKKCSKFTIYLADMVFDSLSVAYYQKP